MILFNNNFSSPITKTLLSEYFTTVTNPNNLNTLGMLSALATGSTLVHQYVNATSSSTMGNPLSQMIANPQNFQIVTEKFLKVLDKVYTKIWNESFTETGIYNPINLVSLYSGFAANYVGTGYTRLTLPAFVSRCITAGILTEADRLDAQDQIFISQPNTTISTSIDTANSIITFSSNSVIDVADFNTQAGSYLNGKKLYLLMTPFIANESVLTGTTTPSEPVTSWCSDVYKTGPSSNASTGGSTRYSPWGFFKPKSDTSKFGSSLPLATHLFWRIGTPEDKEMAILEGTEVPEIIFDHLDRVSHIDTFQLKVKYGPIQFA